MTLYDKWTSPEGLKQIQEWVDEGLNNQQITEKMDVGKRTLMLWKKKSPELDSILPKKRIVAERKEYETDGNRAKAYLYEYKNRWQRQHERIENMNNARLEALEQATSITAHLDPVRVQTSRTGSKIERCVLNAEELQEKINNRIHMMKAEKGCIKKQIDRIKEPLYQSILFKVFVEEKPLMKTSDEVGIAYTTMKKHIRFAYMEFEAVNPELFEQKETD